jgi:hypothetical protein
MKELITPSQTRKGASIQTGTPYPFYHYPAK